LVFSAAPSPDDDDPFRIVLGVVVGVLPMALSSVTASSSAVATSSTSPAKICTFGPFPLAGLSGNAASKSVLVCTSDDASRSSFSTSRPLPDEDADTDDDEVVDAGAAAAVGALPAAAPGPLGACAAPGVDAGAGFVDAVDGSMFAFFWMISSQLFGPAAANGSWKGLGEGVSYDGAGSGRGLPK
jgi:hypothetical protein